MSELSTFHNLITDIDYEVLKEINRDYGRHKNEIERYLNSKNIQYQVAPNPTLVYLTQTSLLNLIQKGLCQLLHRIDKTNSYYRSKTFLNGIDFLAEFLYNMNPKYLERHSSKINIFDMDWVKNILAERPRPFYPLSLLWSETYAALKIQANFRGYRQRKKLEVEEIRHFWRHLKEKRNSDEKK